MNKHEATFVAKTAAMHAIASVREQISDIVRHEMPAVSKEAAEQLAAKPPPRGRLFYVKQYAPVSDYTQVLNASWLWRRGRGKCLGTAWMNMPGTKQRLLIEQYGQECSLLVMDLAQPQAEFDTNMRLKTPGKSPWTKFASSKGLLEDVVAKQKAKGWELVIPTPKQQLELVDAVAA